MPRANTAEDKVRRLQVKLYRAAKQSPVRRFHVLYDKVHRDDVLHRAWERRKSSHQHDFVVLRNGFNAARNVL